MLYKVSTLTFLAIHIISFPFPFPISFVTFFEIFVDATVEPVIPVVNVELSKSLLREVTDQALNFF